MQKEGRAIPCFIVSEWEWKKDFPRMIPIPIPERKENSLEKIPEPAMIRKAKRETLIDDFEDLFKEAENSLEFEISNESFSPIHYFIILTKNRNHTLKLIKTRKQLF